MRNDEEKVKYNLTIVTRKNLYKEIIKELTLYIRNNNLKPGMKLPSERDLSEQLGVSRNSLREALRVLELRGILSVRAGQGIYVNVIDIDAVDGAIDLSTIKADYATLLELHEVRKLIEVEAAKLASQRAKQECLEKMEKNLKRTRERIEKKLVVIEEDIEFHSILIQGASNKVLEKTYCAVTDLLYEVRKAGILVKGPKYLASVINSHEKIFEAVKSRNKEASAQAMEDHLETVAKDLLYHFLKR